MENVWEWGYRLIEWAQQFSPALDTVFKTITALGSEYAYLLLLPLIFWCVDKRHGARLGVLVMISAFINHAVKDLFDHPRPSPDRVKVLAEETSPGLPSGHSQNGVVVYGYLASLTQRRWAWVVAGLVALLVGLSRIYLGVHFPSDVLGGWFIGVCVLALYLRVEPEVEYYVRPWPWTRKMTLAVGVPVAFFLIYANTGNAQLMGTLVGLMGGLLIEGRWVGFSAKGPVWQRVARFLIGAAILIVIWLGTKAVFPDEPETVALTYRFIRYVLVGSWASLGAPWLFVRLSLAPRERDAWG